MDTLDKDPVSALSVGFAIQLEDYQKIGSVLRKANLPTVFVQEGGYDMERLGKIQQLMHLEIVPFLRSSAHLCFRISNIEHQILNKY